MEPPGGRGIISSGGFQRGYGSASVSFNGGVFESRTGNTEIFDFFAPGSVELRSGGGIFDTSGNSVGTGVGLVGTGGLAKTGNGTLTLSGCSTYTGATVIERGTLAVQGSLANSTVTVMQNGTLSGTGLIGGRVEVQSGGTFAIGNSAGNMTFGSDLVLLPGSVSEFEIDSLLPGEFDLALSGAGVQEVEFGGSLNLFFRPGFNMTGTVTLFDFETFTGNFSAVNATGLAPGYSAFFDASNGTLSLVPEGGTLTFLGLAAVLLAGMRVLRLRNRCG